MRAWKSPPTGLFLKRTREVCTGGPKAIDFGQIFNDLNLQMAVRKRVKW